jgi:hypothetical protein
MDYFLPRYNICGDADCKWLDAAGFWKLISFGGRLASIQISVGARSKTNYSCQLVSTNGYIMTHKRDCSEIGKPALCFAKMGALPHISATFHGSSPIIVRKSALSGRRFQPFTVFTDLGTVTINPALFLTLMS